MLRLVELAEANRHVAADDDRTPARLDDDHLQAARVARRRDEPEPGQQLELAVDRHVLHAGRLDPLADRVVVLAARVVELPALDVDRPAGEQVVAAAVVEVQVRVDDDVDAGEVEGLLAQWNEPGIHVGHRWVQLRHAGVDQHARVGMVDDVHVDRPSARPRTSNSATRTGAMAGGDDTRPSCHSPREPYPTLPDLERELRRPHGVSWPVPHTACRGLAPSPRWSVGAGQKSAARKEQSMSAQTGRSATGAAGLRELAPRSGDRIDVALLWEWGADRVFVVVDDERRGERFLIAEAATAHSTLTTRTCTATGAATRARAFRRCVSGYDRA